MATYDPTLPAGQVRLLITDTDVTNPIFTDAEINAFLTLKGQNVLRAAIMAYETIIRSRALLAKAIARSGYSTTAMAVADMQLAISRLEKDSFMDAMNGVITDEIQTGDDNFENERPLWRDLNQVVIE